MLIQEGIQRAQSLPQLSRTESVWADWTAAVQPKYELEFAFKGSWTFNIFLRQLHEFAQHTIFKSW